ncbi:unnamed protein product, partial [Pylaiella littoralis]
FSVVIPLLLLCIRSSHAIILSAPKSPVVQHQHPRGSRCWSGGGGSNRCSIIGRNHERYRRLSIKRHRLRASTSAAPPPGGQQQRAVTSPLSVLNTPVALPAVPDEKQDDSTSASASTGCGASSTPSTQQQQKQQQRDVNGDSGKEKVRRRRSKSKSKSTSIFGFFRRTSSDVLSYLTIMTTWLLFRFLLKGFNKVECHNRQALLDAVLDREDRGLLTVSNHMCVYDDPGLWSALLPFWRVGRAKMRWALCTDDIYYAHPILTNILHAGRTLPIKRTRGMEQPLFKAFFQKLEQGEWGHIFAEGAIRQPWRFSRGEPILSDFKAGIGRLLLRSEKPPLVLPMYHIGMHQIAPETPIHKRGRGALSKIKPNVGRQVRVYVGEPIDIAPIINKCR